MSRRCTSCVCEPVSLTTLPAQQILSLFGVVLGHALCSALQAIAYSVIMNHVCVCVCCVCCVCARVHVWVCVCGWACARACVSPRHQAPNQLGGHLPRVISSRSLTRTIGMESSTLCNDAKQEHQETCTNPSLLNPNKTTNDRERLERKNKSDC
jgi:hypothetical protein